MWDSPWVLEDKKITDYSKIYCRQKQQNKAKLTTVFWGSPASCWCGPCCFRTATIWASPVSCYFWWKFECLLNISTWTNISKCYHCSHWLRMSYNIHMYSFSLMKMYLLFLFLSEQCSGFFIFLIFEDEPQVFTVWIACCTRSF